MATLLLLLYVDWDCGRNRFTMLPLLWLKCFQAATVSLFFFVAGARLLYGLCKNKCNNNKVICARWRITLLCQWLLYSRCVCYFELYLFDIMSCRSSLFYRSGSSYRAIAMNYDFFNCIYYFFLLLNSFFFIFLYESIFEWKSDDVPSIYEEFIRTP